MTKEQLDEMMKQCRSYCNDPESERHKHIFVAGYQRGHRTGVESEKKRAACLVEALGFVVDLGLHESACANQPDDDECWCYLSKAREALAQYQKGDE